MTAARGTRDKKALDKTWSLKTGDRSTKTISRMSALVTCYNAHGQQLDIPNMTMSDSFTGMQDLFRECIRLGADTLDPDSIRVTFLQAGPSSFDFQFDLRDSKTVKTWGKHPSGWDVANYVALDQALAGYATVGELAMLIAANPDCELRWVETLYGPDVEVLVDGLPRMVFQASLMELMGDHAVQSALRAAMAPLTNPEFGYVTIRGEVQGAQGVFNQVMVSNESVREFIQGEPLKPKSFEPTVACQSEDEIRWNADQS